MLRTFRKYNKQLLAVFMTLLMIVFVAGSAFDDLVAPSYNQVIARSDVGEITIADQRRTTGVTNLLEMLQINWKYLPGAIKPIDELDWTLLVREVDRLGIRVPIESVRAAAQENPMLMGVVERIALNNRLKTDEILSAIAEYQSVQLATQAIAESATPSAAEVRATAQRVLEKVKVNAVVLPASMFVLDYQEFPEETIREHWEKYRATEPGPGLEFGYFQPVALQVQYIQIDPQAIAEEIGVANLERKAQQYFEANRESDPRFQLPADQQVEGEPPYMTWEQAEPLATAAIREQAAKDAAERIANWLISYTGNAMAAAERDTAGYKQVPAAIAEIGYYEDLIQKIPATIAFPDAVSVVTTELFQRTEATDVEGIGKASYRPAAGSWRSFPTLAFLSQPVVAEIPQDAGDARNDYLARWQTSPFPLTGADGTHYVFRVVDSKPPHAAETVDEVRDEVLRDLRLLDGFQVAREHAEELRRQASEQGLQAAYEADEYLAELKERPEGATSGFYTSPLVPRMNRFDVQTGNVTPVSAGWGIGQVTPERVAEWFELEYALEKVAVQGLPERATVLVVEWVEKEPARINEFEEMRETLVRDLANARRRAMLSQWLDSENIRARLGFRQVAS